MTALAIRALLATRPAATVVGHCLVHHVPSIDDVLIAVHHGVDVLTQALVEHFLLHWLTFAVGEHPVGKLRMPAEAVATQLDAVLAAEVSNLVGTLPVPHTLFRMNLAGLHVVLSGDGVELLLDESNLIGVRHIALVHGHTNREVVLVGIHHATWHLRLAKAWALRVYICAAKQEQEQRQQRNVSSFHLC